jgi:hypothetical protein
VVCLPPSSPDVNPIAHACAKITLRRRRVGARTWERVVTAVGETLRTVSEIDARAFFADAGFPITAENFCTPL